ncbi:MAG TPA: hypothetical protein H9845_03250 [Candidatus Agathobaculum pullicola]|nr:hypothetical protein [Candidatus Agathobaculum pullicola]
MSTGITTTAADWRHFWKSTTMRPVYTCHCTGPHAYDVLRETLGERIAFLPADSMIEV